MKFESARPKHNGGATSSTGARGKGAGGLPWNDMTKYRLSSGEVRAIQMGYFLVVSSIILFAVLAHTMLLPALKSQSLHSTECHVTRSEIIRVKSGNGQSKDQCGPMGEALCLKVHVVYKTTDSTEATEYAKEIKSSHGTMRFHKNSHHGDLLSLQKSTRVPVQVMQAIIQYDELQGKMCTIRPACSDDENNRKMISLQASLGRSGLHVPCFYDPRNLSYVILRKQFDRSTIITCLMWPGIICALGVTLIVTVHCCIGRFKSPIGLSDKSQSKAKQTVRVLNNSLKKYPRGSSSTYGTSGSGSASTKKSNSGMSIGIGLSKFAPS